MEITTIGVIGAGTMGNGIAHVFAQAGYTVRLMEVNGDALKRGIAAIEKNMDRQVKKGTLTEDQKKDSLGRIVGGTDAAHVKSAQLIVEAIVENAKVKCQLFQELDSLLDKDAFLASNTSSISITELA